MAGDDSSAPAAGRFLTAEWRWLVMINYEVDPALLEPLVPSGTTLDLFGDRALVSMVGFRFLRTRVLGVPIPFHRNFDEVNLRFYVRRRAAGGETRRGVVFVSEIVPRAAIAWVARRFYNENYRALPMRHSISLPIEPGRASGGAAYEWRHGGRVHRLAARVSGEPELPTEGSEEQFITEHYWGYSAQRDGSTVEYGVEHPSWRLWQADEAQLDCDVAALYGARFAAPLAAPPSSALIAEGSPVVVRKGLGLRPA